MITLYHCSDARSFRPLWALEELGLPYELKMLPFPPRFQAPDYMAVNPLGTIPLLLDGETRMTESAAICQYLATRYGPTPLAVTPEEPGYGAFLNALHFGEATLTFPLTLVLRYERFEKPERKSPQIVADYTRWFLVRLRAFEAGLNGQDYVAAGRFTVADISVGYALMLAVRLGIDAEFPPAMIAYLTRVRDREGFRRADAAQQRAAVEQTVALTDFKPE
ncbi:MAG TPA: glutathione S-transferase [Acetobacteraceae bacterium]|nr:glutathione S-transferase [Acetobacteraceae bacterium]